MNLQAAVAESNIERQTGDNLVYHYYSIDQYGFNEVSTCMCLQKLYTIAVTLIEHSVM